MSIICITITICHVIPYSSNKSIYHFHQMRKAKKKIILSILSTSTAQYIYTCCVCRCDEKTERYKEGRMGVRRDR